MGPPIPLRWISGDVCPKFQSRSGSPTLHASSPVCNIILRYSSRRPAWQSSHSNPRTCKQASVGLETRIYRVRLLNVLIGEWIAIILLITGLSLIFTVRKEVGVRLCFYTCLWFCSHEGCYPSMHCRWYLSMPCSRSPWGGGGMVSQHALQVVSQHAWGLARGLQAHLPGPHLGGVSRPTPGEVSRPTPRGWWSHILKCVYIWSVPCGFYLAQKTNAVATFPCFGYIKISNVVMNICKENFK